MPRLTTLACILALLLAVGCSDDTDPSGERDPDSGQHDAADTGDESDTGVDADTSQPCEDDGTDTDDDGLSDCREEELGTDPGNPDSDGDGLTDGEEVDMGLDPLAAVSFGDGIEDAHRWFVGACSDPSVEHTVIYKFNSLNGWRVVLPLGFQEVTELGADSNTPSSPEAMAYHAEYNDVAAFTSRVELDAAADTRAVLRSHSQTLSTLGSLEREVLRGEFETRNSHRARIGEFVLHTQEPTTPLALRNALVDALHTFDADALAELPVAYQDGEDGDAFSEFVLRASVTRADYPDDSHVVFTSLSLAPKQRYDEELRVGFTLDNTTDTNHLAKLGDALRLKCDIFSARALEQPSGAYTPETRPTTASVRILMDERWVPRAGDDGFRYAPESNALTFHGDFEPSRGDASEAPDFFVVTYTTLSP